LSVPNNVGSLLFAATLLPFRYVTFVSLIPVPVCPFCLTVCPFPQGDRSLELEGDLFFLGRAMDLRRPENRYNHFIAPPSPASEMLGESPQDWWRNQV
jgi:hypothetical protein